MKKEAFAVILLLFLILLAIAGERSARMSVNELINLTERSEYYAASGRPLAADRLLKAAGDRLLSSSAAVYLPDSALNELQQSIYALRQSVAEGAAGLNLEYEALRYGIISSLRLGTAAPGSIFTRYFCRLKAWRVHP